MEITLLPKLKAAASLSDFSEWKAEFSAFVDLVIKADEFDTQGLKMLKYAISASKLCITFDGHATYKSAMDKIERQFRINNSSSTPLTDFFNYKWCRLDDNFAQYIHKLQSMCTFVKSTASKNEIVIQHCVEQFSAEFRVFVKDLSIEQLIETVSQVKKEDICKSADVMHTTINASEKAKEKSNIVCHNCSRVGHYSSNCRQPKGQCTYCKAYGHLNRFCMKKPKNSNGACLLAEVAAPTEMSSAKFS